MRVTGGTIEYGETRKIAEYENKKASVIFTFAIEDGTEHEVASDFVDRVTQGAIAHVHNILGIKSNIKLPAPKPTAPVAEETAATPPGGKKRGRPKKETEAAPVEEAVGDEPAEDLEPDAPAEDLEPDAPAISDQHLVDQIAKRAVALGGKDAGAPQKIKKLIANFAPRSSAIPQEQRARFLTELAELK